MGVLMQARSSVSGELVTWVTEAPDWAGADFPGPGAPQHVAVSSTPGGGSSGSAASLGAVVGPITASHDCAPGDGIVLVDTYGAAPGTITVNLPLGASAGKRVAVVDYGTWAGIKTIIKVDVRDGDPAQGPGAVARNIIDQPGASLTFVFGADGAWYIEAGGAYPGGELVVGSQAPHGTLADVGAPYTRTTYTISVPFGPQVVRCNSGNDGPTTVVLPAGAPIGFLVAVWDSDGSAGRIPNSGPATGTIIDIRIDAQASETIIDGDAGVGARVEMRRAGETVVLMKVSNTYSGSTPTGQWMVLAKNWQRDYRRGDIQIVSASTTVVADSLNRIILVDTAAAAGATTITLPLEVPDKTEIIVKDKTGSASTKNITVQPHASDGAGREIDGALTKVISTNYGSLRLLKVDRDSWITL